MHFSGWPDSLRDADSGFDESIYLIDAASGHPRFVKAHLRGTPVRSVISNIPAYRPWHER